MKKCKVTVDLCHIVAFHKEAQEIIIKRILEVL